MKHATKLVMIIALLTGFAVKTQAQASAKDWAELKTFHSIMAATFHPSEDGDLKPIRERSGEMAEKAKLLAASKVPADFDKPEMKKAVQELVEGTAKLDGMIKKKATDKELTEFLAGLHDTFHKIVGLCQPGDKHEEHDHSDPNHKH
ncbi:MAG: hypothetical protein JJE25_00165 [Bacteroidia bacterium]|nr:hypothetical protein [Bacteroidia bacterium]